MSDKIYDIRHSGGDNVSAPLQVRDITIRARAADWCHLSALMAAVVMLHRGDEELTRDAAEWERLLDAIGRQEGLT